MAIQISLEKLLETGAHFGHQVRRWNPKIAPYLYGDKDGVHIFDLIKTKEALEKAIAALQEVAQKEDSFILFVGTKKQIKDQVRAMAERVGCPHVSERWLGGTLTNFEQIQKSIKHLKEMKEKMAEGGYNNLLKKERVVIQREIETLERKFGGLTSLTKPPELLVIIDIRKEKSAVKEAEMKGVPVIAITDTNTDPTSVTYPIPMNDDATRALEYVLELFEQAILEARGKKASKPKTEKKTTKKK